MKKITIDEWLAAEVDAKNLKPQPKGSVTTDQYAELRECSVIRARIILNTLCKSGLAKKERWADGHSGARNIYWLIKK